MRPIVGQLAVSSLLKRRQVGAFKGTSIKTLH